MRKHMHCSGPPSASRASAALPTARIPVRIPSSQPATSSTFASSTSASYVTSAYDERREMEKTELENEKYLKVQAEKYKEQQEMKRKEEEKAAAEKQAAEKQAAEKEAAALAAIPYNEESVRRQYRPCSQYVDQYRGTTVHAYYLDKDYMMRDINETLRVPKPQPKPTKKRKWQEVVVRHNSPYGDTSQLCEGEEELQWVYM